MEAGMSEVLACDMCNREIDGEVYCGDCAAEWIKERDELWAKLEAVRRIAWRNVPKGKDAAWWYYDQIQEIRAATATEGGGDE
jgi:hypothetical protein